MTSIAGMTASLGQAVEEMLPMLFTFSLQKPLELSIGFKL